jgi:membrane protease YdiL (CAAX protease family)
MTTDPTAQHRTAPPPVRRATKLMLVLAVLTFGATFLVALGMATAGGVAFVQDGNDEAGVATGVVLAIAVIVGVLAGGLCWLAIQVRRGHAWARTLATVLLVVGGVFALLQVVRHLSTDPIVIPLFDGLQLAFIISSLAHLWGPAEARAYFATGQASGKLGRPGPIDSRG